ncbi:MAG: CoA-binding protein [Verrucomicrobiales bacterium]|nr:CoA-binding protein [Verrucomicrobiales bacterium]
MSRTVAVLGASSQADRYSNKAVRMLLEHGHRVIPVNPGLREVAGQTAVASLSAITDTVDTLTVYVAPERLAALLPDILGLRPARVILNPGTESPAVEAALSTAGIPWRHACTLVLLRSGQF